MKTGCEVFAMIWVLAATAGIAEAQDKAPVTDKVDLAAVLRIARDVSPRLELERQGIAQAEADRITAGAYPNPTVTYGRQKPAGGNPLFEGSQQQDASLAIPLLIAGQREARVTRAEREIEAARSRVTAGSSTLAAEAASAFVALLAAQNKAARLAAANEEIARLRNIVAGRESAGAASRYDVARMEVELGNLRAKHNEALAEVADRSGSLAALLGLRDWRPVATGPLRPLDLGGEFTIAAADRTQKAPATIAAERQEAAAQSAIEVARRERWPVPSLTLGRSWTSDPFGASNIVGFVVEVPLLDTRRGPLSRAEADARAATLKRELVTAETGANLQRLESVIAGRQAALDRFDKEAAGRLAALKEMAEAAYQLGRATILELLDATRSRYDMEQTYIDLIAGLMEAQVRYLSLAGKLEEVATPP